MLNAADNELLTRTGPRTPTGTYLRRFWQPALLPAELPTPDCAPVRFRLMSEDLVAFRDTSGRVGFLAAKCPHRRASLFWGRNEEDGLRCVYHGWKFDVNGNCVDMPSEPDASHFKDKVHALAYPARERGGIIWIYMGPAHLMPEFPDYDWCLPPNDPNQQVHKWRQESNYLQGLEGNLDSAHVSFLHRWFGRMLDILVSGAPKLTAMETDFGFVYGARRPAEDGAYHWRVTPFVMPGYTVIPNRWGPGAGFFTIPMDDHHSWWFTIQRSAPVDPGPPRDVYVDLIPGTFTMTHNITNDLLIDRDQQVHVNYTGLPTNRVQDAAISESMGSIVDRPEEHLGTSDIAIIFMRRMLLRAVRDLANGIEPAIASHPQWHHVMPLDVDSPEADLARVWTTWRALATLPPEQPPQQAHVACPIQPRYRANHRLRRRLRQHTRRAFVELRP
jgi:phenylpropionate dioxygenase-like ring-hydroxylating dioxygenase large terminal subunit